MAAEEQVVCWCYGHGVAHECAGVEGEGAGHAAGDAVVREGLAGGVVKAGRNWVEERVGHDRVRVGKFG